MFFFVFFSLSQLVWRIKVEQERAEQKLRDAKKAKKQREDAHEKGLAGKDPEFLQREIRKIEREGLESGKLGAMQKAKIERLKELREKALEREVSRVCSL